MAQTDNQTQTILVQRTLQQIIASDEFLSSEIIKGNLVLVKDSIFFPHYVFILPQQDMKVMDGVTLEGREIYRNKIIDALAKNGLSYSTVIRGYTLLDAAN